MDIVLSILEAVVSSFAQLLALSIGKILAFAVTTIIAALSVYYGYKSYRSQRQQYERSPKLVLDLMQNEFPETIYILLPFGKDKIFHSKDKVFRINLDFIVKNIGDKAATNVELISSVPDVLYHRELERKESNLAISRRMAHAADEGKTKHLTQVYNRVGDVPPDTDFYISLEVIARDPTLVRRPIEGTTRDGRGYKANIEINYALVIDTAILCRETSPATFRHSIQFKKGSFDSFMDFIRSENRKIMRRPKQERLGRKNIGDSIGIVCFSDFEKVDPNESEGPIDVDFVVYAAKRSSMKTVVAKLKDSGISVPMRKKRKNEA